MMRVVLLATLLCACLAWADESDSARLETLLEIKAKIELTETQAAQVEPIIEEHFNAQLAVLDKHGIDISNRDGHGRLGLRKRRALRRDLEHNLDDTTAQLANVLSAAQLYELEDILITQKDQLRDALQSD